MPEDLEQFQFEVAQESKAARYAAPNYDLGDYFNSYAHRMLKTVPPTRQFLGKQVYKHSFFILCFVESFEDMFDSVLALQRGETDLSDTIFYKLMTICGNFMSHNEGKKN